MLCRTKEWAIVLCLLIAGSCVTRGRAADEKDLRDLKPFPREAIVAGKPVVGDVIVQLRPLLSNITAQDPLRVALHFSEPKGPMDHLKSPGTGMLDRTATLESMVVTVQSPDGKTHVLKPGRPNAKNGNARPAPQVADKTIFYNNPTFLLQLDAKGIHSLTVNGQGAGQPGRSLPWKWEHPLQPGVYRISLKGDLSLAPQGAQRGQAAKFEQHPFEVGPVLIHVAKSDAKMLPLDKLQALAVASLKTQSEVKQEGLKVRDDIDRMTVEGPDAVRIVRIAAMAPPPANPGAPAAGGGVILLAPRFGRVGWRYEITMSPDGKPLSFAREGIFNCLAKGTQVRTPTGLRPIERIQVGDEVESYDEATGQRVTSRVQAVTQSIAEHTLRIGKLRVTASHPIYVGGKWKAAGALTVTDRIIGDNLQPRNVGPIQTVAGRVDVYDLTVSGTHNFFADGVLVHNKSIAWTAERFVPWYVLWNRVKQQPGK